jgi:hypothetical protein
MTGPVLHPAYGLYYRSGTADEAVIAEVWEHRHYEPPVALRIPPHSLILDAGAHIGAAARWFRGRWRECTVAALEPEAGNFALLVKNAGTGIHVNHGALVGVPSPVRVTDPDEDTWGYRTEQVEVYGKRTVSGTSVDLWLGGYPPYSAFSAYGEHAPFQVQAAGGGYSPFIAKLDIEGAEKDVFEAPDLSWIDRFPAIVCELHDRFRPGCAAAWARAMEGRGRRQLRGPGEIVWSIREDAVL